jgi:hypothetical protein
VEAFLVGQVERTHEAPEAIFQLDFLGELIQSSVKGHNIPQLEIPLHSEQMHSVKARLNVV